MKKDKSTASISTSDFEARCSQVIQDVAQGRGTVIITKRGRPVAKLVPAGDSEELVFGFAKGRITIHDDIVEPLDVEWEAARRKKEEAGAR